MDKNNQESITAELECERARSQVKHVQYLLYLKSDIHELLKH